MSSGIRDEEGRAKSLGDEEKEAAMRKRTKKKVFMEEKKIFLYRMEAWER
ncbi:hypothetical protein EM20IM_08145 [Candidatus Methylacidiphilum infernorum]|uniref:Uncharacterized protein n=1 Tax=Candidatus Methylacidiphilum infernorum TaxID=511746 RepID=A0ABX7PV43_9BACT|nr:hypothetical protein [Candidatus Methylacidiphilum infernorum]QSR86456.1 hypothetical protein EM20IM_08145 [Candidatus Methylacidiphilum infernorum]